MVVFCSVLNNNNLDGIILFLVGMFLKLKRFDVVYNKLMGFLFVLINNFVKIGFDIWLVIEY